MLIRHHGQDPVITKSPLHGIRLRSQEIPDRLIFGIISTEASGICGNVQIAIPDISHIIHLFTGKRSLPLRPACLWVISIKSLIIADPIPSLPVTENKLRCRRSRRMGHYTPVTVEPEHTAALHGTPTHTVIPLADRCHA